MTASPVIGTAAQYVTFQAYDPRGPSVRALMGDGYCKWTNKGGWIFTPRRRRLSMAEYTGDDPLQMTVPCILDSWTAGGSVESPLDTLRGIMTNIVGPRNEPAIVRVSGAGVPLTTVNWVIQNIEVTDEIRLDNGPRTRVELTVTLFQYVVPDIIITSSKKSPAAQAKARNGTPSGTQRTYTVRSGDTLWDIAARFLGNGARWGEIATLNGVRDPRTLRIGQVLRIPA